MKTENQQEQDLNSFIDYCKQDDEYLNLKTYTNSVIIYFKNSILTNTFKTLIKYDFDFFVYKSIYIDEINNEACICLFIYKKKDYVFN